jgi:hypothetical protein
MCSAYNFLNHNWRIVSVGYFRLGIKISGMPIAIAQLRTNGQ